MELRPGMTASGQLPPSKATPTYTVNCEGGVTAVTTGSDGWELLRPLVMTAERMEHCCLSSIGEMRGKSELQHAGTESVLRPPTRPAPQLARHCIYTAPQLVLHLCISTGATETCV